MFWLRKKKHYFFITHFYLEVGYEKPFGFPIIQYPFESMGSHMCTNIIFLGLCDNISASQAERVRFYGDIIIVIRVCSSLLYHC